MGDELVELKFFIKDCLFKEVIEVVNKILNGIIYLENVIIIEFVLCKFFFYGIFLSDIEVGIIILVFFIGLFCICFVSIVKVFYFMFRG